MQNFWNKIKLIWTDSTLRKKILFVLLALIIFRALAAIPIPGIDADALSRFLSNNQFFGIFLNWGFDQNFLVADFGDLRWSSDDGQELNVWRLAQGLKYCD